MAYASKKVALDKNGKLKAGYRWTKGGKIVQSGCIVVGSKGKRCSVRNKRK